MNGQLPKGKWFAVYNNDSEQDWRELEGCESFTEALAAYRALRLDPETDPELVFVVDASEVKT